MEDDGSKHHPNNASCSQDPEPLEVVGDGANDDASYTTRYDPLAGLVREVYAERVGLIARSS